MKLAVRFALALVVAGCGGSKSVATASPAADLAESVTSDLDSLSSSGDLSQRPGADFYQAQAPADLSSTSPDMASAPPDLWMCTPLNGNCVHTADCCNAPGTICEFPVGGIQPQYVCCFPAGHACVATSDCCYGVTTQAGSYCNQTTHQCTPN